MRVAAFDVGILNMVYVVIELTNQTYRILHWKKIIVGKPDASCEILVHALISEIEASKADFANVDVILIERQMVLKLCVLAHTIQTIFITNGLSSISQKVILQHATRKNQCGRWLQSQGAQYSPTGAAKYRTYKQRAIFDAIQCLKLQENTTWLDMFKREPKQDDFADALLHAIWYLFVRCKKEGLAHASTSQCDAEHDTTDGRYYVERKKI